jgi:hypothetical protein|tara:strand:+ start:1372 stop:1752 length:381 start_codon:yes stop_codon:yes gene_type:complete
MSKYKEIDRSDLSKNELLRDGSVPERDNDYFILGDKLDTVWWKTLHHEKLSTGQVGSGYQIDFVDGTQLKLSTLQLFSIINDWSIRDIETQRWTLHEINKDTWKGTIREEVFSTYESKVYVKQEEE